MREVVAKEVAALREEVSFDIIKDFFIYFGYILYILIYLAALREEV